MCTVQIQPSTQLSLCIKIYSCLPQESEISASFPLFLKCHYTRIFGGGQVARHFLPNLDHGLLQQFPSSFWLHSLTFSARKSRSYGSLYLRPPFWWQQTSEKMEWLTHMSEKTTGVWPHYKILIALTSGWQFLPPFLGRLLGSTYKDFLYV